MTVQTSEGTVQDKDGELDREASWVNIPEFVNIRCHIQERGRQSITDEYNYLTEANKIPIFHMVRRLYEYRPREEKNQTSLRILVNRENPAKQLVFPIEDEKKQIDIYEFKGHIEEVKGVRKSSHRFFVFMTERTNRWEL